MPRATNNSLRDTTAPLALLAGDTMVTFAGLLLGWWLRYESPLRHIGITASDAVLDRYLPLLFVGVALLIGAFAQFGLYDGRMLLRRYQSLNAILKGTAIWLIAYLGVSLVLKFDPPISRVFAVMAFACVIVLLYLWRNFAYAAMTGTPLFARLRRRAVLLGWNDEARALARELERNPVHPIALAGVVALPGDDIATLADGGASSPRVPLLGLLESLDRILSETDADMVIAARLDVSRGALREIVEICERRYVEWKIVPGAFEIFLTGLRLQTIGRIPVLGVEELAIDRLLSRAMKRGLDLAGAVVGLTLSLPVIVVLAALIKRESPSAPVLFRQPRIGANHRPFTLYKLRSMTPLAADETHQDASLNRRRLLRIGAFVRRWNLDELPQFWNVLCGDMSLVGPRPEIPSHVDRLAQDIPHYMPRHLVKPGMTGWAQVNGLRGGTDFGDRIQHDIYYIENWSIWLDVQIILLTFVHWRSPSAG